MHQATEQSEKPAFTPIPVPLREAEVPAFSLPPLSLPKRGPQGKLGSHQPFTDLLKVLYPGMPGKEVPIDKGSEGKAALPSPGIFNLFSRWAEEGSWEQAGIAAVPPRADEKKGALAVLQGDGSPTVAQQGGRPAATGATTPKRGRRESLLSTLRATGCRR